jgi:regulator of nucleoside diphosphate kinase
MRPALTLATSDRDLLERAALDALLASPREAGFLLEEIDRAQVVADDELGDDVVRLGSQVVFVDGVTGARRQARLVSVPAAEAQTGEVSALTSVGAALVGLAVGQSILWEDRRGARRVLRVLAVGVDRPAPAH